MEVLHRRTYERLGPHDQLEGFEHWKEMKIKNKRPKQIIGSKRRGRWSDVSMFYVGKIIEV